MSHTHGGYGHEHEGGDSPHDHTEEVILEEPAPVDVAPVEGDGAASAVEAMAEVAVAAVEAVADVAEAHAAADAVEAQADAIEAVADAAADIAEEESEVETAETVADAADDDDAEEIEEEIEEAEVGEETEPELVSAPPQVDEDRPPPASRRTVSKFRARRVRR